MNDQIQGTTLGRKERLMTWLVYAIMFALVAAASAWLVGAVREAREAARATQCRGHFAQLSLALHNYHDVYGSFPPAYVADSEGRPMHSWRVLILPFLDQQAVYEQYDFSEPWDGPNNRRLAGRLNAPMFSCPSGPNYKRTAMTDYVVIIGPETAFPGAGVTTLDGITDGSENTILFVEIANSDIHWMEPRDLHADTMSFKVNDPAGISSPHTSGPAVSLVDGSSLRLLGSLTPEVIKALTTISGDEPVSGEQLRQEFRDRMWNR